MPIDHNKEHEPMHTKKKFGRVQGINIYEQLNSIKVNIIDAPSIEQLRKAISVFMMNTWNDKLRTKFDDEDIDKCIVDLFAGNILPTGMEIIGLVFSIEGMNLVDTTHLIRHRLFSFSAQTHADRDMRDDNVMMPASIMANENYYERALRLAYDASNLYADMMDTNSVNCLDARLVMPRFFEHFYVTRCCLKDAIGFCIMRGDEQIQTHADNIIAMKLWLEISKLYPFLAHLVDFRAEDKYYVGQCKKGKTSLFPPNKKNDVFDYATTQFYHFQHRDEYDGANIYLKLRDQLLSEIDDIISSQS